MSEDLSHTRLMHLLHYDPETGLFTRLVQRGPSVKGDQAGCLSKITGYIVIRVDGKLYQAHRLAWFYMTGEWPLGEVDHKDLDGSNNAWLNLRGATRSQNSANCGAHKDNRSGSKGVFKCRNRFQAQISIENRKVHIGTFDTAEEAHAAYMIAAKKHFGEYARSA